jgi:AcrR family transcriptional regulator
MSRWKPDAAGRLMTAAITLFGEQGYDETTIAEIAARAGLTKRTFFRYFADKREVLFSGSQHMERLWLEAVAAAPADADPLTAATAGFDPVAEMFTERHQYARMRARIIASNPELQERELIKLQALAGAINTALAERGISPNAAILAAQATVTVFHVAFARWVQQDDPAAFRQLMDVSLKELRSVTAAQPQPAGPSEPAGADPRARRAAPSHGTPSIPPELGHAPPGRRN